MAQLSAAIDGIAEACTALGTPITGGNVSLYNETKGEGIYPTPVLGIVGLLEDVRKAVPDHFQHAGDAILQLFPIPAGNEPDPNLKVPVHGAATDTTSATAPGIMGDEAAIISDETETIATEELSIFGSSEYAHVVLGGLWGVPPTLDLEAEADLQTLLQVLAAQQLVHSARDISDGGIAVALAQSGFPLGIGATVEQDQAMLAHPLFGLFAEPASNVLVSASPSNVAAIEELAATYGYYAARIGSTGGDRLEIGVYREKMIAAPLAELREGWATALESNIHGEVHA